MRDPKRIPDILFALRELWYKYPELRFFQLLDWVTRDMCDGVECIPSHLFYLEDDALLLELDKYMENFK